MKLVVLKVICFAACSCVGAACAQASTMTAEPVVHRLEFGNDGQAAVRNVDITYGAISVPEGAAHKIFWCEPQNDRFRISDNTGT